MKRVKFWTRVKREKYEEWKLVEGMDPSRVPVKSWKAYNLAFWDWKAKGAFYPVDDLEAYQIGVGEMIRIADRVRVGEPSGTKDDGLIYLVNAAPSTYLVSCAYLALCKHKARVVDPTRRAHRKIFDEVIVGKNDKPDAPRHEIRAFVEAIPATSTFENAANARLAAAVVYATLEKLDADARRGLEAWLEADGVWEDAAKAYSRAMTTKGYQYRFHEIWAPAFINACEWRW